MKREQPSDCEGVLARRMARLGPHPVRTLALVGLSVAGLGVSAYLTTGHYRGGGYFCAGLGDCDYVNSSPYAEVAGVPVAVLGLIAYAGILVSVLWSLWRSDDFSLAVAPLITFGLALGGILFSAYLTYVELFILHAI